MKIHTSTGLAPTSSIPILFKGDPVFERMMEIHEAVARRAYEMFASAGFTHGHDLEDWFQAETEFLQPVPLDIAETEDGFKIRAEVPGFMEKDMELRVDPRRIFLSCKREEKAGQKKDKTLLSEWRSKEVARQLELPAEIDPGKVQARLIDGVLEITLQKAKAAKRVPVEVKAA